MKKWQMILAVPMMAIVGLVLSLGTLTSLAQDLTNNGTVPPIQPFVKTAYSESGLANRAYSGENLTYTVRFQRITDTYTATIRIVDLIPPQLSVHPDSINVDAGKIISTSSEITWTIEVTRGGDYVLTYRTQSPIAITSSIWISNVAVLSEIANNPYTPTTEVLTASVQVEIRPYNLHLPIIELAPAPTPTPTPQPLPQFKNNGFEAGSTGEWSESPIILITSLAQNYLANTDGNFYAWLGGRVNQTHQLSQTITLPAGYSDIRIRYRYWIYSEESDCINGDKVEVLVNGVPQSVETEGLTPHQLCSAGRTFGWKLARTTNSLASLGGQSITLTFQTQLNQSRNSNFFVDVIELCSSEHGARTCNFP